MANFNDFSLRDVARDPRGVYSLAGELLPEMANAMGYDLGETPTTEALQGIIKEIGPAKTLQDNIGLVQERLATEDDAVTIAADWAKRSGCLKPMQRNFRGTFVRPGNSLPIQFDTAVFNTGVGRWQERRAQKILDLREQGKRIGRVVILAGNRQMSEKEHPMVAEIAQHDGYLPTETRFAADYIAGKLRVAGVTTHIVPIYSSVGDEIFTEGIAEKRSLLLDGVTLAVGNAPATIQVAGQFRKAAISIDPKFDDTYKQLYMAGDGIRIARFGEGPATHQNPFTALGQIARNALYLHEVAQAFIEK